MNESSNASHATLESFAGEVPGYYLNALKDFEQHGTFEGMRVLEIGGSALPSRLVLDALGVQQWVCVDIINHASGAYQQSEHAAHYAEIGITPLAADARPGTRRYEIFDGSAADIPPGFFGQFDIVFSINAFEHVLPLSTVLERAHQSLRAGGVMFAQFGPIWSCEVGSHFWVRPDFCFNAPDPMPPWAHLRYSREQLSELLLAQGLGADDLHHALYQLYESSFVNRRFFEDYEAIMAAGPFQVAAVQGLWHRPVPADILGELERLHPGHRDFSSYGIRIVARRAPVDEGVLEVPMPGPTPAGLDDSASARALGAAARRALGDGLVARLTAGLPPAAWPLLPWPAVVTDAATAPDGEVSGGWSALFAERRRRADPSLRLLARLEAPGVWVVGVLQQLYGDPRFAGMTLPPQTLWATWYGHARRLLNWMAAGTTIDIALDARAATPWPLEAPDDALRLFDALRGLLDETAAADAGLRARRAAELLDTHTGGAFPG